MIAIQIHTFVLRNLTVLFSTVKGAWLQFVYMSKRPFSSNILLLEFLPEAERKLNEIKAGQSDAQTS